MSYSYLGQDLHETADGARKWFANEYGAVRFECEKEVATGLQLRPTWQADLKSGYKLCINVQPSPFSPTIGGFVTEAARLGLPIKLWVVIADGGSREAFAGELKQARNLGVGVVQISEGSAPHEFHRAVPVSLFGLARTNLSNVPAQRREVIKNAEATFLDGTPDQGCQAICQDLELISRQFAEKTYRAGWWTTPSGSPVLKSKFFMVDAWARMLEALEQRADLKLIVKKCPHYSKQVVVRTRSFTDWRNAVSHKPKTLAQLKVRDSRLRTMFEATRDVLVEWYTIAKPLGLVK